jgi:tetratricopeptide (TPR) repeat protein
LALVLGAGGDYQETTRALQVLGVLDSSSEKLSSTSGESTADQRAKIALLARSQNVRQRRQAVSLLESLLRRQQITNSERLLLAQLYESIGQWPKAHEQFVFALGAAAEALNRDPRGREARLKAYADQLTLFCTALLRNDAASRLEPWLLKLEEVEPQTLRTLSLRAQQLHVQGQADKAVPGLLQLAKNNERATGPIAAILEKIGQMKLAEDMYQRFVSQAMKPEANLVLAAFYGRHERIDEALAICEAALKTCRIEDVVSSGVMVLYSGKPSAQQCQRVASWIESTLKSSGDQSTGLMNDLAAVHRLQKNYAAMIELYQRIIRKDPTDTTTLNNLAWVLALNSRNGAEALQTIQRAIELDGPQANLLDTRAVAYIVAGDHRNALQDIKEAMAEQATAHRYFHLAQVHQLAGDSSAAREALQRALRLGLSESGVDPLEVDAFQRLRTELDSTATSSR